MFFLIDLEDYLAGLGILMGIGLLLGLFFLDTVCRFIAVNVIIILIIILIIIAAIVLILSVVPLFFKKNPLFLVGGIAAASQFAFFFYTVFSAYPHTHAADASFWQMIGAGIALVYSVINIFVILLILVLSLIASTDDSDISDYGLVFIGDAIVCVIGWVINLIFIIL